MQDIEWARDGDDGKLYIVQARPETVASQKKVGVIEEYKMLEKGRDRNHTHWDQSGSTNSDKKSGKTPWKHIYIESYQIGIDRCLWIVCLMLVAKVHGFLLYLSILCWNNMNKLLCLMVLLIRWLRTSFPLDDPSSKLCSLEVCRGSGHCCIMFG
jgi:hypothetical protein